VSCRACRVAQYLEEEAGGEHTAAILALAGSWRHQCKEKPVTEQPRPHFGFTRHHGLPVHARTADHLQPHPDDSAYQRFNKKVALWLTRNVGTMTCFWVFLFIAFLSLPATLVLAALFHAPAHMLIVSFALSYGFIFLVDWLCQNVIQLVLLPGLMVGQNLQNIASDARAAKQFEDLEEVRDWLNLQTQGGLTTVLEEVQKLTGSPSPGAAVPAGTPALPPGT
jgi:hypothetical protein